MIKEKPLFKGNYLYLIIVLALLTIPKISSAVTIIVAASDASAASKASANYVCDGVNDQAEIQTAINAAGQNGMVQLTEGTFKCTDIIAPAYGQTFAGKNATNTYLKFTGEGRIRVINDYVTLKDFKFSASNIAQTQAHWEAPVFIYNASHIKLYNLTGTADATVNGVFFVQTWHDKIIEDLDFVNCKAIPFADIPNSPGAIGFLFSSGFQYSVRLIKNVRLTDCQAIDCGRYSHFNDWIVGFDLAEQNDIEDLTLTRCIAEGSQESGFHFENVPQKRNVVFNDCISRNNAQKPSNYANDDGVTFGPLYGAGYWLGGDSAYQGEITLNNCVSENNLFGYPLFNGKITLNNCSDVGSKFGFYGRNIYSPININSCQASRETYPIYIQGGSTYSSTTIDGMTVSAGGISNPSIGMIVNSNVANPQSILVKNSTFSGYPTGIDNWARSKGSVKIQNVTFMGATTNCNGCEIISGADTSPPSVPSGLTANAVSTSQINLSWSASTDNIGVAGYRTYRNGTQIATTTNTTYSDTNLTVSTTYTYTVAAHDAAGNVSAQSSQAQATTQSSPASTPGDISGPTSGVKDGKVDVYDVSYLLSRWGSTNSSDLAVCDINPGPSNVSSSKIDIYDANLMMKSWTG